MCDICHRPAEPGSAFCRECQRSMDGADLAVAIGVAMILIGLAIAVSWC